MTPTPDLAEAQRFLAMIDEGADIFLFQTATDDPIVKKQYNAQTNPDPLARIYPLPPNELSALSDLNSKGAAVWLMINEGTKRRNEKITRVRAVFADCDATPLQTIMGCDLEPHIIVESSRGHFHPYWLVDGLPLDRFTDVQRAIKQRFNGDAVVDLARVMRLPGFVHQKDLSSPYLSRIVHVNERLPYSADEILAAFPPAQATPAPTPAAPAGQDGDGRPASRKWTDATATPHVQAVYGNDPAPLALATLVSEAKGIWNRTDKRRLEGFKHNDGSDNDSSWDYALVNLLLSSDYGWNDLVNIGRLYREKWNAQPKPNPIYYWAHTIATCSGSSLQRKENREAKQRNEKEVQELECADQPSILNKYKLMKITKQEGKNDVIITLHFGTEEKHRYQGGMELIDSQTLFRRAVMAKAGIAPAIVPNIRWPAIAQKLLDCIEIEEDVGGTEEEETVGWLGSYMGAAFRQEWSDDTATNDGPWLRGSDVLMTLTGLATHIRRVYRVSASSKDLGKRLVDLGARRSTPQYRRSDGKPSTRSVYELPHELKHLYQHYHWDGRLKVVEKTAPI